MCKILEKITDIIGKKYKSWSPEYTTENTHVGSYYIIIGKITGGSWQEHGRYFRVGNRLIPDRAVGQWATKPKLYKGTRVLKNGKKELIYRGLATDEQITHAKDFIDLD